MLPSETMIWQPEFTDKTLSRKPGAVHNDKFVLRYGNSVVGVVNKSFGKVLTDQRNTSSPAVERVEVNND
ncbi:hypothetical protein CUA62_13170 [Shigella flexneri]|nr:hypothetical protein CUA62_13170 [Shigella flexneri]